MTFPIFLTWLPLSAGVTIIPYLLITFLPFPNYWTHKTIAAVICFFIITDYLDGLIARCWNQKTEFGALLDPLADKSLVAGCFISLWYIGKLHGIFVVLLLGRECIVSLLRAYARHNDFTIPVVALGKQKSVLLYLYIIFVVGAPWSSFLNYEYVIEYSLLFSSLFVSFVSGWYYVVDFVNKWKIKKES